MDSFDLVKAYFAALDSQDEQNVDQYLSEDYQKVDFLPRPMNKHSMLELIRLLKSALPNLAHSLSNLNGDQQTVNLTVQMSGRSIGNLDLTTLGIGIVPDSRKFIIFPNATYEFSLRNGKIYQERDISPRSPNRRLSGMLKALGVNITALHVSALEM